MKFKLLFILTLILCNTEIIYSQSQLELLETELSRTLEKSIKTSNWNSSFYNVEVADVTSENEKVIVTGTFNTSMYSESAGKTKYYDYIFRARAKKVLDTYRFSMIQYKKNGKWYCIHFPSGKCTW